MNQQEFKTFAEAYETAWSFHKAISKSAISMAFDLLKDHTINNVLGGLKAHCLDPVKGQYGPKPADIIYQIERRMSQRLSADEAWLLIPRDESETVVWTDEIAQAASIVVGEQDRVAARMAFKASYDRIVEQNKIRGVRPKWVVSYGWDKTTTEQAIHDALKLGRITEEDIDPLMLPAPSIGMIGLLENHSKVDPVAALDNCKRLKQILEAL